jgi:hypothetical protein
VIFTPAEPGSVTGCPLASRVKLAVDCRVTSNCGVPERKLTVNESPLTEAEAIGGGPDWGSDSGEPKEADAAPEPVHDALIGAVQPVSCAA